MGLIIDWVLTIQQFYLFAIVTNLFFHRFINIDYFVTIFEIIIELVDVPFYFILHVLCFLSTINDNFIFYLPKETASYIILMAKLDFIWSMIKDFLLFILIDLSSVNIVNNLNICLYWYFQLAIIIYLLVFSLYFESLCFFYIIIKVDLKFKN
jgi:hypothetical protein